MRSLVVTLALTLFPALTWAEGRACIASVQGTATLEREGVRLPAAVNLEIFTGDRIRTVSGRVEVMFPDGASLVIEPNSDVEFLTPFRARVIAGAVEHRQADASLLAYRAAPYAYTWHPAAILPRPRHGAHRDPYRPPVPDFRAGDQYQPWSSWFTPETVLLAPSTPPPLSPTAPPATPPAGRHIVSPPAGAGSALLGAK